MKLSSTRKPCFGFFLQGSVKVVAILNILLSIASMIVFVIENITFSPGSRNCDGEDFRAQNPFDGFFPGPESPTNYTGWLIFPGPESLTNYTGWLILWCCNWLVWITEIPLSIFLRRAAKQRIGGRLKLWMILEIILCLLLAASYCLNSLYYPGQAKTTFEFLFLYKIYTFWVIFCFLREIGQYGTFNNVFRNLNDAEVYEFEKGSKPMGPEGPYNRQFEIPLEQLSRKKSWVEIGSGAFGTVYKAGHTNGTNGEFKDVAVKTVASLADSQFFKALLSELKLLTYIGQHRNIVNLVGANTNQIKFHNLMLVMEFCPYGNLQSFLQTRRGFLVNMVDSEGNPNKSVPLGYTTMITKESVTTRDLILWSLDVAEGMEFLASKGVIHADLAARNVLLSFDKVAKICDFGLARRLYSYTNNYVCSKQKMLPWRYLAPDTMDGNLIFSKESDIWSLGITFWQFFSMGAEPWQNYLEFSNDFYTKLKNGMRLERPLYCPSALYLIMGDCWSIVAGSRPKYPEIIQKLKSTFHLFEPRQTEQMQILNKRLSDTRSFRGDQEIGQVHIKKTYIADLNVDFDTFFNV